MKKNNDVVLGVVLIAVGIMLVLMMTGFIDLSLLDSFFTLWPLILVVVGISIIFNKNSAVKLIAWFAFFAILILHSLFWPGTGSSNFTDVMIDVQSSWELGGSGEFTDNAIEIPRNVEEGVLKLDAAAGDITIGSTGKRAFAFAISDDNVSVDHEISGDAIEIKVDSNEDFRFFNNETTYYNLTLSEKIKWTIDIDAAAVDAYLDLSDLTVDRLKVDSAAGSIDVKIGVVDKEMTIDVDAAASDMNFQIPEDVGVVVTKNDLISDDNLEDFKKVGDKYYSSNYDEAEDIVYINSDNLVSDMIISFY